MFNQDQLYPYTYFKLEVDPTNVLAEDDIKQLIRYQMFTSQYIDLDTAHLELLISMEDYKTYYTSANNNTVYGLAIDGSAMNFIEDIKIYSNSVLVESSSFANQTSNLALSLNLRDEQRDGRCNQGMGSGGLKSGIPLINTQMGGNPSFGIYYETTAKQQRTNFWFNPSYSQIPIDDNATTGSIVANSYLNGYQGPKLGRNTLVYTSAFQQTSAIVGVRAAQRTPYALWSRFNGGEYGIQGAKSRIWNLSAQQPKNYAYDMATTAYVAIGDDTAYAFHRGYQIPYSPYLENQNKDVVMQPAAKNYYIVKGNYATLPESQTYWKLKIPLMSSTIGVMRTGHQGLVDGNMLGQLNIEIRLNQYATYATGITIEDTTGITLDSSYCFARKYKIKQAKLIFDTYHPKYTPQEALGPNTFWANAWTLAHQQVFNNTALLSADHQINVGLESVRLMVVRFQLQDYMDDDKTYCRQHYNISGNVTRFQLKMGSLLFPVNPVKGHAGQPFLNATHMEDNQEFIDQFDRCMGTFMLPNRHVWTNNVAFAPNDRPYTPGHDATTGNFEKVGGGTFYLEQKIPRSLYVIRFDDQDGKFVRNLQNQNQYDWGFNGINTTNYRPFTLSIATDQVNYTNRKVQLQVFFYHDVQVQYTPQGIKTKGLYLQ